MYLNCHTYYSLRFGTFSEVDLLELAKENNVSTVALTDINNTSACLNFIQKAKQHNIKPVVGIDFRNGAKQQFVGLARNNKGFQELNDFLSEHLHHNLVIPNKPPTTNNIVVVYPFETVLEQEKTVFNSNEYVGVSVEELRKLPFSIYKDYKKKLVIQQQVTIRNKRDFNAHRLLR
ncbi:PHP domain-containing protein, partial [Lacinutrix venerupis]|uniref:PHP domain-containing protein n=1 Tax=Lacinutrix venerupis TaxID=1486034 RepID=UPI000EAD2249